jgi:cytoskeletal protein CcmA (bactofilin family)
MAIFNKSNDKPITNSTGTTVIANNTKINGSIDIECNLHIDGEFEGKINSQNIVTIGKSGIVTGEIFANKVIVSGSFNGSIDSDNIEILPKGKLHGNVSTNEFVIERGGFFEGESKTKKTIPPHKLANMEKKIDDLSFKL